MASNNFKSGDDGYDAEIEDSTLNAPSFSLDRPLLPDMTLMWKITVASTRHISVTKTTMAMKLTRKIASPVLRSFVKRAFLFAFLNVRVLFVYSSCYQRLTDLDSQKESYILVTYLLHI